MWLIGSNWNIDQFCHSKIAQTEWLKQKQFIFLHKLEARKSKIMDQDCFPMRSLLLAWHLPLAISSHGLSSVHICREGERSHGLSSSNKKMLASSLWPHYSLSLSEALSPNIVTLVVRVLTQTWRDGDNTTLPSQTLNRILSHHPNSTVVSAGLSEELIFIPFFSPVGPDA